MLVTIILDLTMPVSHPYLLWTLRYYLRMTKSQLYVKQKCLPSIISNVTNNKNELGKAARLASFQNAQLQSTLIVLEFDHPYLLFYLSCYLNLLFMF